VNIILYYVYTIWIAKSIERTPQLLRAARKTRETDKPRRIGMIAE